MTTRGTTKPPTPDFDVLARNCPSRPVLEHITGRWGVLILAALSEDGTARFGELRRRIEGVSDKMLSQTLRTLEYDGFVHRDVQSLMPPRVEYSLTPLGQTIATKVLELISHLHEQMDSILAAQERSADAEKRTS